MLGPGYNHYGWHGGDNQRRQFGAPIQSNKPEALNALVKVLGKKKAPRPATQPPAPFPDSDAIAAVTLKMAVERNPKAEAAHIQRCYGALTQETMRRITDAPGKVDSGLLNEILSGVQIKAEPVPK